MRGNIASKQCNSKQWTVSMLLTGGSGTGSGGKGDRLHREVYHSSSSLK